VDGREALLERHLAERLARALGLPAGELSGGFGLNEVAMACAAAGRHPTSPYSKLKSLLDEMGPVLRRERCVKRLQGQHPNLVPVHGPVHASWLNQIEIFFSILQRNALTPNDFPSLEAVAERIAGFERYYESIAKPFEWKFTHRDLAAMLAKIQPSDIYQKAA